MPRVEDSLLKTAAPSWRTGPPSQSCALIGHTCVRWTVSSIGLTSGCPDITMRRFHLQMIRRWCAVHFRVKLEKKKKKIQTRGMIFFFFFSSVLSETHKVSGWAPRLSRANTPFQGALTEPGDSHGNMSNGMRLRQALWQALCASVHMDAFPSCNRLLFLAKRNGDEKSR